jgi:hypothetical protein
LPLSPDGGIHRWFGGAAFHGEENSSPALKLASVVNLGGFDYQIYDRQIFNRQKLYSIRYKCFAAFYKF